MKAILLPFLLLGYTLHAQTVTLATQKRLEDLKKGYESAVTRQAGPAFSAAVKALDAKYLTALDRLTTAATQASKLDEAISLRDEKKRVTEVLPLPETDADAPESLRPLRGIYREQLAAIIAARAKASAPLTERYLEELTRLQTDRTKAGALEDAIAVKTVIDELSPPTNSKSSGTSADKLVVARGSGKTDAKSAQAICEWALANGAIIVTDQGKVGVNEKLTALPKGRFSVKEIWAERAVPSFPWDSLSGLSEIQLLRLNVLEPVTAAQAGHIANLSQLHELVIIGPLSVSALSALPVSNLVRNLTITPASGSEEITPAIELLATRFPGVTALGWSSTESTISAAACAELGRWKRLKGLTTRGDLSIAAVEELARIPTLEWLLCLGNGTIDPGSIPKLKGLKFLNVSYGKHLPGLVEAASQLPILDTLRITMQNRTAVDVHALARIKLLNRLTLRMPGAAVPTDEFAPLLGSLKNLTELELTDSNLTDAGLKHLESLKKLEMLLVVGSQVTDAGLASFKKAVPKCKVTR